MREPRFSLATLSLLSFLACSSPTPSDPPQPGGPTGAECPPDSTLTYRLPSGDPGFAQTFFTNYCIRCHASALTGADRHGAPPDRNYDSLVGLVETGGALIDGAAAAGPLRANTFMPRSDPRPSDAERHQLGEWLACHMPP